MKTYDLGWENKEGIKFYACGWEPMGKPKAVVALVHGHGEHVGRYAHVAEAFTKAGFVLTGFDLRGHGKSGGPRGHVSSYEALMDDIAHFLAQVARRYPGLPLFLYGHSLGGNLVLNFVLRRKPNVVGAIVTGPWLRLAFDPPAVQVILARVMDKIAPGFTQASKLDTSALSHDAQVVKAYNSDPLVHDKISARLYVSMYDSGLWALEHASEFPVPLLLMHGADDRITSAQASREFAERGGKKVTWRAWEGLYHEIHNEPEKAEVLEVMTAWMNACLKKK
jgi:alpha-beta hydrolase superfamily lysophospholipase